MEEILATAQSADLDVDPDDLRVQPCEHREVPFWLSAGDLAICFITPTYSSIGVSPTKLAEYLACGLPVVCNSGVGDVEQIVSGLRAGRVLPDLSSETLDAAADRVETLLNLDRRTIREQSRALHDRSIALDRYQKLYERLSVETC
jgi:glycosyltransferase involved in cell wall biosynthesis